jgi:hypothetical protein
MLKDLIPYLIGEDPERIEYLWQASFRRRFYRGGPATGAAISAIDLHDHKLAVQQQIEYLAAIRKAVGDDVDLILECHGRYDPEWAVELARLSEPYRPFLIEDPIRHENPQALAQVRAHTRLPLAIGERYHSKWDFRETIVNGYVNYLRPDVCHCGGISEMKKIAAFGEAFYMNLIPHNNAGPLGTAATLHAALAIPNVVMIEAPWVNSGGKTDVVSPYPKVEGGCALPLDALPEARPPAPPERPRRLRPRLLINASAWYGPFISGQTSVSGGRAASPMPLTLPLSHRLPNPAPGICVWGMCRLCPRLSGDRIVGGSGSAVCLAPPSPAPAGIRLPTLPRQ